MKSLNQFKLAQTVMERLPAALRQPQWVAVILSLGFHGALFAAGPSFSSLQQGALGDLGASSTERRVPLIELTADEQARLPDFSSSAYSLVPGDTSGLFDLFPPSGDSLNSLPLNPGSGLSSLPDIPVSKPPFSSSPLSISPFPSSLGRRTVVLPSPRQSPRPANPTPSTPGDSQVATAKPPGLTNPGASTPTSQGGNPSDLPSAADLRPPQGNPPPAGGSDTANANTGNGADSSRAQQLARVEYSAERTTPAEVEAAQAAWVAAVQEKLGQPAVEVEEPLRVEIPYDRRLCLTPAPTEGLLGLVALPGEEANTVNLSTTVLKSTGYAFLNQTAEQWLQNQVAEGKVPLELGSLYRAEVTVNYNPETCIQREALLRSRTAPAEAATGPKE